MKFKLATSILSALRKLSAHKVVGLWAQTISMTPRCSAGWHGSMSTSLVSTPRAACLHRPSRSPAHRANKCQKECNIQLFPTIYICCAPSSDLPGLPHVPTKHWLEDGAPVLRPVCPCSDH